MSHVNWVSIGQICRHDQNPANDGKGIQHPPHSFYPESAEDNQRAQPSQQRGQPIEKIFLIPVFFELTQHRPFVPADDDEQRPGDKTYRGDESNREYNQGHLQIVYTTMHPKRTLFESYALIPEDSRLLICNPHDVQLVADLTERAAYLEVFPREWGIYQQLAARFNERDDVTIHETIFPPDQAKFDVALLEIPKGRELARAWMAAALQALRHDGVLYAAGPNKGGAKTAFTDLNHITRASMLGSKARHRIFSAPRPPELTRTSHFQTRTFVIHGESYELVTHPGVFSYDHLDDGTALLLDQLPALNFPPGLRVLDAGCGIGVIGMVAARTMQPREVILADSDLLAIQCARQSDCKVIPADLTQEPLSDVAPFDLILCNPPFHQAHEQSLTFMTSFAPNARRMLVDGGNFVLVYNHFLPYRDLLEKHFASVQILAENGRYTVASAR